MLSQSPLPTVIPRGCALVVSNEGPLASSLQVLLQALPQLHPVYLVTNGKAALHLNRNLAPRFVLLNFPQPASRTLLPFAEVASEAPTLTEDDFMRTLRQLRAFGSSDTGHSCTVACLTIDERQQQMVRTAGANCAFVRGISGANFLSAVESTLLQQGSEPRGGYPIELWKMPK